MALSPDPLVIAVTGAFGSGCSTFSRHLAEQHAFAHSMVSTMIVETWKARQSGQGGDGEPSREDLQNLGDQMRVLHGLQFWAERAVVQAQQSPDYVDRLVIDGIRNPGEIDWLRRNFRRCFVVAVGAPLEVRWERLRHSKFFKDVPFRQFVHLADRDEDSGKDYGQRVGPCIDLADYVITNDDDLPRPTTLLGRRAADLLDLIENTSRRPTDDELFMHEAYAAAEGSACLSRRVGAIVVRPGSDDNSAKGRRRPRPIGSGYNENPDWMQPCFEEFGGCYRDQWRARQLRRMEHITHCPLCGHEVLGHDRHCSNIECDGAGSLEDVFFPERGATHCTAIHAEARALQGLSEAELTGATLYTTTFPCFQCALLIVHAGIAKIVYVESYPDPDAVDLLERQNVKVERFSGVKSAAFGQLFGGWRQRTRMELKVG